MNDVSFPQETRSFLLLHEFPQKKLEKSWRDLLARVDAPSLYEAPEFFLEPHWAGRCPFAVLALSNHAVTAVLTGVHPRGHVICGLPSRPQVCVDPSFETSKSCSALQEGLLLEAGHTKLIDVFAWHFSSLHDLEQKGFRTTPAAANIVLDLTRGADALFDKFDKARKGAIRSAIKNGIQVSQATTDEDTAAYYEVFKSWTRTKRKKIHASLSFDVAKEIQKLQGTHRQFLARYRGKVIAASTVRFYPGGLIEYSSNCSLDEFITLRPNDLLLWKTIEWAYAQGFKRYSLGAAHPFLRKFGGTPVPTDRYRLDRTLFRRHQMVDFVVDVGRTFLRNTPAPLATMVRKALGRKIGNHL